MAPGVHRFWRSTLAGLCGSVMHTGLMALKSWAHWLPDFEPYRDLQAALASMIGTSVPSWTPWLLSYVNGSVVLGFIYSMVYRKIPGQSGAIKGAIFGVIGWAAMGLTVFPVLGKGLFATQTGLGLAPAFFTLLMILTYSVTLGIAYAAFAPERR